MATELSVIREGLVLAKELKPFILELETEAQTLNFMLQKPGRS